MKHFTRALALMLSLALGASYSLAEPHQLIQGTQIHLKLLNDIGTSASRNGDPFIAVTTEQVVVGGQVLLPAGTRIRGIVTSISRARRFSLFRGEALGCCRIGRRITCNGFFLRTPGVLDSNLVCQHQNNDQMVRVIKIR